MIKKLVIVDNGNIIHKSIFAYSSQYKKAILSIVKNYYERYEDIEVGDLKSAKETLDEKIRHHDIYMMYPPSTYLKMVIGYLKKIGVTLDDKVIMAEDYGSWRKEIDKNYKAQRKAFRESKEEASWWTEQYGKMNELMIQLEKCLPWNFIKIYKMESDDIASCAIRFIEAEEKILISSDEDWAMLCTLPNTKVFSPYTKKFKIIKNPEKILLKKIRGDISDNLLEVPKTEAEFEKRRMIVDLIHLPQHIEQIIKPVIDTLPIKNLYVNKVPFRTCQTELKKLYNL